MSISVSTYKIESAQLNKIAEKIKNPADSDLFSVLIFYHILILEDDKYTNSFISDERFAQEWVILYYITFPWSNKSPSKKHILDSGIFFISRPMKNSLPKFSA